MAFYGQTMVGKAAATVLDKTAEIDSAIFKTEVSDYGMISVKFAYTKGDETNGTIRFYVSNNKTDYFAVEDDSGKTYETLTATSTKVYRFSQLAGWKFFKVTVRTADGTPTGTYGTDYYWFKRGSQR